jgi:hypothetical protein
MLKTAFWQKAAQSLPAGVRARHLGDIARAERFEILVDAVINAASRLKEAFAARRPTHQH